MPSFVLAQAYQNDMYHIAAAKDLLNCSNGDSGARRRVLAVIRTHASPHAFVERTDNCNRLRWYAERASTSFLELLSVDRVIHKLSAVCRWAKKHCISAPEAHVL